MRKVEYSGNILFQRQGKRPKLQNILYQQPDGKVKKVFAKPVPLDAYAFLLLGTSAGTELLTSGGKLTGIVAHPENIEPFLDARALSGFHRALANS